MMRNTHFLPDKWMWWGNEVFSHGYAELKRLVIPPKAANMHLMNSTLPAELQPRFFECALSGQWFIPDQGPRQFTAESIAWIMTLRHPDGSR